MVLATWTQVLSERSCQRRLRQPSQISGSYFIVPSGFGEAVAFVKKNARTPATRNELGDVIASRYLTRSGAESWLAMVKEMERQTMSRFHRLASVMAIHASGAGGSSRGSRGCAKMPPR